MQYPNKDKLAECLASNPRLSLAETSCVAHSPLPGDAHLEDPLDRVFRPDPGRRRRGAGDRRADLLVPFHSFRLRSRGFSGRRPPAATLAARSGCGADALSASPQRQSKRTWPRTREGMPNAAHLEPGTYSERAHRLLRTCLRPTVGTDGLQ